MNHFLRYRNAFLHGMASAFDPCPAGYPLRKPGTDAANLAADWQRVGRDIATAIRRHERNH